MTTGSSSSALRPAAVEAGRELAGRYRLLRPIGTGASAAVWLAHDASLDRDVAVKILHEGLAEDPSFLESFRGEARSAAGLGHPNVLAVHDWGEAEVPFLVSEYLGGGSLRSMIDAGQRLSPSQVIAIGLSACRGLHFAHRQDLVHRDVKPANLLFGADARLRIADFGLACALAESGHTEPGGNLFGTARYASPEQAQGKRLSDRSDVYSLGLTLIEALSGKPAFSADTPIGTLMARIGHDPELPEGIPPKLAETLRGMTGQNPEARPDAARSGLAFQRAAEGLPRPEPLPLVPVVPSEPMSTTAADVTVVDAGDESRGERLWGAAASDPAATNVAAPPPTEVRGTPTVRPDHDGPARRWPWLLVTIVAVAAAAWFAWTQVEASVPIEVAVPDVVGLERSAAIAELGDTWVIVEKLDRVADVPQGNIIRTEPAAGELLPEGQELQYWVSLGLPLIRVPEADLLGRSRQQAVITLENAGLAIGAVEEIHDERVGEGLVMAATASAPELPQGSTVDLTVSLGPVTRVVPTPEAGQDISVYVQALTDRGLGNTLGEVFDPDIPAGEIISLEPEPGTPIERGETVAIVLSLGPEPVPVPDVGGLLPGDAIDVLEAAGFLPIGEGQFGCPAVGTDPPEGTRVQPGEPVTIIISECADG